MYIQAWFFSKHLELRWWHEAHSRRQRNGNVLNAEMFQLGVSNGGQSSYHKKDINMKRVGLTSVGYFRVLWFPQNCTGSILSKQCPNRLTLNHQQNLSRNKQSTVPRYSGLSRRCPPKPVLGNHFRKSRKASLDLLFPVTRCPTKIAS